MPHDTPGPSTDRQGDLADFCEYLPDGSRQPCYAPATAQMPVTFNRDSARVADSVLASSESIVVAASSELAGRCSSGQIRTPPTSKLAL
jgi:hypothetical protein